MFYFMVSSSEHLLLIEIIWILLSCGAALLCQADSRRVQIQRPFSEEEQETVNYYAAEPQDDQGSVVLVSSADRYNGFYGQQSASSRSLDNNYIPRVSTKPQETRNKEPTKAPPVQTIRNYNKVNDDGSFTFGYEAADGSFKEETRGTDCVVRGKYGYVDPDGNKREFTYVSGNPCDPNAPKDQEEPEESNETENENVPANYPTRPIQPLRRPIAPKPSVTLFQNTYAQEEEQPEPEQLLRPTPQPVRRPAYASRPQYVQQTSADEEYQVYHRPQSISTTTPSSVIYKSSVYPITITPRPVTQTSTPRSPQLPATTYRPQSLQVSVTPRPTPLTYTKQLQSSFSPSTASPDRNLGFEREFQRFQQENIASSTSAPKSNTHKPKIVGTPGQVYSSALIYDPTTGQYNNQLYQNLPQSEGEFVLKQRIQPYVQRPSTQVLNIQQLQQQSPLYSQNLRPQPVNSQAAYQAQQSELQFQNSAQLYAQQQMLRAEQEQQQQQQQQQQKQQARQPVYYIQPNTDNNGALAASQIDAFLRGHNIQF
ncbi:hypothetical protein JTB14_004560 [Gonioctena quinquepunctata]|nr:hypothetical protein JTB14_004560 [Gonioctena quinquepunctata]